MFLDAYATLQKDIMKCFHGHCDMKAEVKLALDETIKPTMSAFERNIPSSGYITGGDRPSIADLAVFDLYSSPTPGLIAARADLSPYPKFVALAKKVATYPAVADYIKERGF